MSELKAVDSASAAQQAAGGPPKDSPRTIWRCLALALLLLGSIALASVYEAASGFHGRLQAVHPLPIAILLATFAAVALVASAARFIRGLPAQLEATVAGHEQARANLQTLNEKLEEHVSELSSAAERCKQELVDVQRQLRRQTQFLSATVAANSDALVLCDHRMNVLEFNPGAAGILGALKDVAVHKWHEIFDLLSEATTDPLSALEWPLVRASKGELVESSWLLRHKQTQSEIKVTGRASPVRDESGAIRGLLLTLREPAAEAVSAAAPPALDSAAASSIALAARPVAEAVESSTFDFVERLSRELGIELSAIVELSRDLLEMDGSADQHEPLSTIVSGSKRLLGTVSDLADYVQLARDALALESAPFQLSKTVNEAVESMTDYVRAKGLVLSASMDELPDSLRGDARRLQRLLANLIAAAVQLANCEQIAINVAEQAVRGASSLVCFEIPLPGTAALKTPELAAAVPGTPDHDDQRAPPASSPAFVFAARMAAAMGGELSIVEKAPDGAILRCTLGFELSPAEVPGEGGCPTLDPAVLAELRALSDDSSGEPSALRQVAAVFLRFLPVRLEKIAMATADADVKSLARQARGLRDACAQIGAARLASLCSEIEALAASNSLDLSEAILPKMRREAERVRGMLSVEIQ